LIITYGSSSRDLARSIGSIASIPVLETSCRHFPDGEQFVKVSGDVRDQDVAVVCTTALNPDPLFMEYSLIVDAVKGSGCRSVIGIMPYMAYARQDSRFNQGEPLSAKLFAKLIEDVGTDRFITVDMHLHRFKKIEEVFSIPAVNLSAMPLLAEYYKRAHGTEDTTVAGPDMESEQWASIVARRLGVEFTILEKERMGDREVSVSGELSGAGRSVVLVDDIVSTGKTLIEVISKLKSQGVKRIDALVTHALLVENALSKMKSAGLNELISTDTVPGPHSKVSVAPLVVEALIR
jgi:ribose-phosphate pyrophosphokinase